jgi:hypothetical protein
MAGLDHQRSHTSASSISQPAVEVLARSASTRLALEAAKARGRMYLADPLTDDKPAAAVVAEMVRLLDQAPEAATSRHGRRTHNRT